MLLVTADWANTESRHVNHAIDVDIDIDGTARKPFNH